jgi:hypothetical protein
MVECTGAALASADQFVGRFPDMRSSLGTIRLGKTAYCLVEKPFHTVFILNRKGDELLPPPSAPVAPKNPTAGSLFGLVYVLCVDLGRPQFRVLYSDLVFHNLSSELEYCLTIISQPHGPVLK